MIARLVILAVITAGLAVAPAYAQRGNGNGNGNGNGSGNGGQPPACTSGSGNAANQNPNCIDIALTIESDIDFGRLVLLGDGIGQVWLDLATGQRYITGSLDAAGGMPVTGRAVVNGAPLSTIRVELPDAIVMADPAGGQAELHDFRTNLPAAPMLDSTGQLQFTFSGTLRTGTGVAIGGRLRGRVPITVSYD